MVLQQWSKWFCLTQPHLLKMQTKIMLQIICDSTLDILQKKAVWKLFASSSWSTAWVRSEKKHFLHCDCGKLMLSCQCCEWANSGKIFPNAGVKPVLWNAACSDLIPDLPVDNWHYFQITKSKAISHKSLCTENVVIANNGHLKDWKFKNSGPTSLD